MAFPFTLQAQPNQQFSYVVNSVIYRIRIYDIDPVNHIMALDFNINGVDVITGVRGAHGQYLLPWDSLTQENGNFMLYDPTNERPYWTNFTSTCQFLYLTQAETLGSSP